MLGGVLVHELVDHGRALLVRVVDLHERLPLVRERVLREDRLDRALRLARAAIDALLGVDHEDPAELVDAVDGADVDARAVFDVDAGLGDDVRHAPDPIGLRWTGQTLPRGVDELLDELGARSTSADFTITWSKPAVCARWRPAFVGVVREAEDRDFGHASTTSSGSIRAMSQMTRSGGSTLSEVTMW